MKNKNFRLYSHEEKRMWYDKAHILFEALEVDDSLYSDIMMSTDKMDSTGKVEVYEGDILYYPEQDYYQYGIIEFSEDLLAFILNNGAEPLTYDDFGMGRVVGNIYENPELVKFINSNAQLEIGGY